MTADALDREWRLLPAVDPAARSALDAPDPEAAYEAILSANSNLLGDADLPHVGVMYCAWAELEDLYEIGRTPHDEFHALVRAAAANWLARPEEQSSPWIDKWVADTRGAVAALFGRDGSILDGRSS